MEIILWGRKKDKIIADSEINSRAWVKKLISSLLVSFKSTKKSILKKNIIKDSSSLKKKVEMKEDENIKNGEWTEKIEKKIERIIKNKGRWHIIKGK